MFGIYIHIPFCMAKCNYCSFISKCENKEQISKYIDKLCNEIKLSSKKYKNEKVTSIYFGGGTPSFINEHHIGKILSVIKQNYNIEPNIEVSIECNPCSTTKQKLEFYKRIGVNRISFGVQSLQENELKTLGRKHTPQMAINAISMAKDVGFCNISADVMIGIPYQTKYTLSKTINQLISTGISHISAYMLMLEEGTPLFNMVKEKKYNVASDDECVDLYNYVVKTLKRKNFARYEISNFAKKNNECKHNLNYWKLGNYIGFGVASHSYYKSIRFSNSEGFNDYYKYVENLKNNDNIEFKFIEKLTKNQQIEEAIMLGLRTKYGVCINALNELGYNILNEKKEIIKELKQNKIIKIRNKHIILTEKSFGLCSAVVLALVN